VDSKPKNTIKKLVVQKILCLPTSCLQFVLVNIIQRTVWYLNHEVTTFAEYGVDNGITIHLLLRLRGGGPGGGTAMVEVPQKQSQLASVNGTIDAVLSSMKEGQKQKAVTMDVLLRLGAQGTKDSASTESALGAQTSEGLTLQFDMITDPSPHAKGVPVTIDTTMLPVNAETEDTASTLSAFGCQTAKGVILQKGMIPDQLATAQGVPVTMDGEPSMIEGDKERDSPKNTFICLAAGGATAPIKMDKDRLPTAHSGTLTADHQGVFACATDGSNPFYLVGFSGGAKTQALLICRKLITLNLYYSRMSRFQPPPLIRVLISLLQ